MVLLLLCSNMFALEDFLEVEAEDDELDPDPMVFELRDRP